MLLTFDELLSTDKEQFDAIASSLSLEQCKELLCQEGCMDKKIAIALYNKVFSSWYATELKKALLEPVTGEIEQLACYKFQLYKKYSREEFQSLVHTPQWGLIVQARKKRSFTLEGKNGEEEMLAAMVGWDRSEKKYLTTDLSTTTIDEIFLKKMHFSLVTNMPEDKFKEKFYSCFRPDQWAECKDDEMNLYLPCREVEDVFHEYISWLQEGFSRCIRDEANPIVFAALAYQRFISIHPFENGNGRAGRLLCDLILKHFGLLPPTWLNVKQAIFPYDNKDERVTPTNAVEALLAGMDNSYALMDLDV